MARLKVDIEYGSCHRPYITQQLYINDGSMNLCTLKVIPSYEESLRVQMMENNCRIYFYDKLI